MPISDYPFITVNPNAVEPSELVYLGGPNARPYLWVRIANPATGQAMIVPAAVDTGADAFAIPATDAETLGHNLEATTPKLVRTAKGITKAYPHAAAIDVLGVLPDGYHDESVILYSIPETVIYLTVGQKAHLIGHGSFLSRCILTIDYPEKKFSIHLSNRS
jgi:predicted aspartyl protease